MSAALITGTSKVRVPSDFSRSTARPRPTWSWWTTPGLPVPSTSATKLELRAGTASSARTTAKPIRWVKLTLPPEVRARCWLSMARFTSRSLAGTERTLVAVGTDNDAAMFCAMRAAAPRRGDAAGLDGVACAPSVEVATETPPSDPAPETTAACVLAVVSATPGPVPTATGAPVGAEPGRPSPEAGSGAGTDGAEGTAIAATPPGT